MSITSLNGRIVIDDAVAVLVGWLPVPRLFVVGAYAGTRWLGDINVGGVGAACLRFSSRRDAQWLCCCGGVRRG